MSQRQQVDERLHRSREGDGWAPTAFAFEGSGRGEDC